MGHGIGGKGILARLGRANYELTPLVVITGTVMVLATSFSMFSILKKTDVALFKRSNPRPWERVNPAEPQKLLTLNQEYKVDPAIEKLKREVGSAK
ncbi:normal mucosa of esophagus-specific gene 1 protein-like [Acanthaster planci]|uniref:Normal mucosa of esophagus-specific gene 1 protein-like n=1 Tax=Acanthaster planci TaxID=133434 RepID=A0A8B7XLR8_ACAPL|nr:normal mucosa of esophagus-specific gene 1 protein-like [Acanthaster planci]XP_022081766.1 normal mucosa of esophagus-specific gene 1 protein-like [Acanthaster planci]